MLNRLILILLINIFMLPGCAAFAQKTKKAEKAGVFHVVGKGETLWRISKTYGVDMKEVSKANHIKNVTELDVGRRLFIPGAKQVKKVVPFVQASVKRDKEGLIVIEDREKDTLEKHVAVDREKFLWPVRGEVISRFGKRHGSKHEGIDIKADAGTPIEAADDGEAVFVSTMRGYGKVVILKHGDDYYTVYAHNKENLVKAGDSVSKGDTIALVGDTGNATSSHLHFEVRQGKSTMDPLFFLP